MPKLDFYRLDNSRIDGPDGLQNFFGAGGDGAFNSAGDETIAVTANSGYALKEYTSMTLNAGHTFTTDNPCRGIIIRCLGDVTIEGTLHQNAKSGLPSGDIDIMPCWEKSSTGSNSIWKWGITTLSLEAIKGGAGGNGGAGGDSAPNTGGSGGAGGAGRANGGGYGGGGGGGANAVANGNDGGAIVDVGLCNPNVTPVLNSGIMGAGGSGLTATAGTGGACFGAGGGGGGPNNSDGNGGAGGYAGGCIIIIARGIVTIAATGVVSCDGAAGGAGGASVNGDGGGGGGAGGGVIKIYYAGDYVNLGTVQCSGGAGGASTDGTAGSAGSAGNIITQKII